MIRKSGGGRVLLKKAGGVEKGCGEGNKSKVGRVSKDEVREIGERKMEELNGGEEEGGMGIIEGSGGRMGMSVE
ncbi:uL11 family ribosomal protein [Staphylococcus epidermidis]|uniref:hypothetical protein n=1 Tax=Staphylococcus epidermidis TaxID=1282 RepID=UPI0011AA104D|nr:hypothetical protein [Staphylococcus epidermidis]